MSLLLRAWAWRRALTLAQVIAVAIAVGVAVAGRTYADGIVGVAGGTQAVSRLAEHTALLTLLLVGPVIVGVAVAGASAARRGEVGLLRLRGLGAGQLWRFVLIEPLVAVATGTVLGLLIGVGAAHAALRWWLPTGVATAPIGLVTASAVLTGLAVVAGAVASTVAASSVLVRERLPDQLSAGPVSRRASTVALVGVVLVLAATAVSLVQATTTGEAWAVMAAPMLVALSSALLGGRVLGLVALRLTRRRPRGRGSDAGIARLLAVRRLGRRDDTVALIGPVVVAATLGALVASTWVDADTWRTATAYQRVGAGLQIETDADVAVAWAATRAVDPEGRWLAAALVADGTASSSYRRVFLDLDRWNRVVAPAARQAGTDLSPAQLTALRPAGGTVPVQVIGTSGTVSVDSSVRTYGADTRAALALDLLDEHGRAHLVTTRVLVQGTQLLTLRDLPCADGCVLRRLGMATGDGGVVRARGDLVVTRLRIGADPVTGPGGVADWRPALPRAAEGESAVRGVAPVPGGLSIQIDSGREPAAVWLTPTSEPLRRPVITTGAAVEQVFGIDGESHPATTVATVAALPVVGTNGTLADLGPLLLETGPQVVQARTVVLARADTPAAVLAALARRLRPTATSTAVGQLDRLAARPDALGMRVLLLSALGVALLAVMGSLGAVSYQRAGRRRELSALRAAGVSRGVLRAALWLEMGVAAVAGAAAAVTGFVAAQPIVLRTGLILPGPFDAPPESPLRWGFAVAVAVAVAGVGALVVPLLLLGVVDEAQPAGLREGVL